MKPIKLLSFDTETHRFQPGLKAPPMVCASTATEEPHSERLLSRAEGLAAFRQAITDPTLTLGGASINYDLGVVSAEDPSLVDLIFQALEDGRLISTDVLEKLHTNATGELKEYGGNSLAELETRYLGIDRSAEKEDGWRERYALLEHLPLSEWPDEAVQYPRRDARGTFDVLARQLGLTGAKLHEFVPDTSVEGLRRGLEVCRLCSAAMGDAGDCPKGKPSPRYNLQCVGQEMKAAWFLQLASIWGMRTDPNMVPGIVGEIRQKHEESRRLFFDAGIVRVRRCNRKDGEWERHDEISLEWLTEAEARLRAMPPAEWIPRRLADLAKCKKTLAKGERIRFAEDKGLLKDLIVTAYQGNPPMTAGGEKGSAPAVSTSRDTLEESGDQLLEDYGEAGPNEKLLSTYCDVLEQGTRVPICPGFNSTLSTQRTSYFEPNLTQLPRKGKIREAFVPRPGWCFVSMDYAALEMATLAQCCKNLGIKQTTMLDAINAGQDLHTRLGARVIGIGYAEALALKNSKDPMFGDIRQSMKPINYGKGGLMGPPKIVLTARKDGIYFCENAGLSRKGECHKQERVTRYGKGSSQRVIPPTCCACLELAVKYSDFFYEEWPEMHDYHDFTIECARDGERGEPLESFGTGMLRLETSANACSNHYFQNLAAQGAKHAVGLVTKEAYTDRSSVLFNNARLEVFGHDEWFGEMREPVMHEAAERASKILNAGMRTVTPDVVQSIEPAAQRRWFKSAEKLLDKKGRLKPWWPKDWAWEPDQAQMAIDRAA